MLKRLQLKNTNLQLLKMKKKLQRLKLKKT